MAFITPVSGGSQPVFATDVLNGPIAQGANIAAQGPTNFQGPKLDFFSAIANVSLAAQGGVNQYVANVIQAVQQVGTVAIFQVGPNNQTMNFGIYPTGAFANVAVFQTTVQSVNTSAISVPNGNTSNAATFTSLTAAS